MSTSDDNEISAPLVASLADFRRGDILLAGGKGANLGELVRSGFTVPAGFVVTTAAYDLMLQAGGLGERINQYLTSLDSIQHDNLERASRSIQEGFVQAEMPPVIPQVILKAYRDLGVSPVAVRSSATAEDLPEAAFAGQQETYLNVQGEAALLQAVQACWASLWSERAIQYRSRQKVDHRGAKLAVVIQQMVQADAAGVMFTANPVSGNPSEISIDANLGLGEAVVGGMVIPDHYVIDKRRMRLKEQRIGRKEVIVRAKMGGGTEQVPSSGDQIDQAALSPVAIRTLARLGESIENHYGSPQDIEWAWIQNGTRKGEFFILQARPMTALPKPPKRVSGAMRMVLPMLAEMWPIRPYPLDMTTFTGVLERAVGNLLVVMLGKSAPDPDAALQEEDGVVVRFEPPAVQPSPAMVFSAARTFWRTRRFDPTKWEQDPLLAEVVQKGRELNSRETGSLSWEENIRMIHEALALIPLTMRLREMYLPRAILGLGGLWLLVKLAGRGDRLSDLLGGVETKTTETNRALQGLAEQIRQDRILSDLFSHHETAEIASTLEQTENGRTFLKNLAEFLAEYGHRETALTISEGAWKDQPQVVLGILKVEASTSTATPASYQAWQVAREELLSHSILGWWPFRRPFLRALADGRALFQIREDTHFYATLAQPPVRQAALALGRLLTEQGVLERAEDVFHLRLDELEGLGRSWPLSEPAINQIRSWVAKRQAKRVALAATPMVDPRLLAMDLPARPGEKVLLAGSPGSPGIASGPARIVCEASQFGKLRPGDVLVAPVTNPAWTPLFQHAAAVVVDTGGSASHAAIVAREYGVPAVMGTLKGTSTLTDGQWITVDGSRGLVLEGEQPL